MNGEPLIKTAGLWAKASTKGSGRYPADRLGDVKILVLVNRDRRSESEPSHFLFFAQAAERRPEGQEVRTGAQRDASASWQSAPRQQSPFVALRRSEPADTADRRPFDDEIAF